METINRNFQHYLKTDLRNYKGEWIAIHNNKIVAHGKDVKRVYAHARKKYPSSRPLLSKVRSKDTMIL